MAIPGSIVAAGKLVTPGGAAGSTGGQGNVGPPGPNVVSADAGNIATLGSDNLILVPQSTLWSMRLRSYNSLGNPSPEVNQRLPGATSVPNGTFLADRWALNKTGSMVVNGGTNPNTVLVPGTNFEISATSLYVILTTQEASLGAGDYLGITQAIETVAFRPLEYDAHSLSLLVQSNVALTFSIALTNAAGTRSLTKLCTVPAQTGTNFTLVPLPNLPNFPLGFFGASGAPGNVAYYLYISLACGSNYIAPAAGTWQNGAYRGAPGMNNWAANPTNTTFQIGFAQHEPGSVCSTLQDKPFAGANGNLEECLRYYQKSYQYPIAPGSVNSVGLRAFAVQGAIAAGYGTAGFYKPMAKAPTVTIYNFNTGAAASLIDTLGVTHTGAAAGNIGDSGFDVVSFTTATASAASIQFHYTADTGW